MNHPITLNDRIKAILESYNKCLSDMDVDDPAPDGTPTPPATIGDVLKCLSAGHIPPAYGLEYLWIAESPLARIMEEVMREIAGNDYDPWPELDKEELVFLIGDRFSTCPSHLLESVRMRPDEPLTFSERVLADRHRQWLLKGADAKRKRLAKARADIAKLTGKAA